MHCKVVKPHLKDYELIQLVGQGQFGKVYRAKKVNTKSYQQQNTQDYAVKIIPKQKVRQHPKLKTLITNQIEVLQQLINHPNIVKFQEMIIHDQQLIGMVYQYCDLGTLQERIPLNQHSTLAVLKSLVQALLFAQSRKILHRDIKPANILFKSKGHNEIVKLADWGFSKLVLPNQTTQSFIGSPVYMAPEVLQGQHYDSKADVWSLGVVIYECLFGKCPWEGVSKVQTLKFAIQNRKISFPVKSNISQQVKNMIIGMLNTNPNKRISLTKIKSIIQSIYNKQSSAKKENRKYKITHLASLDSQQTQRKMVTLRDARNQSKADKIKQKLQSKTNLKFLIELFTKVKNFVNQDIFRYCLADLIYNDYIIQHKREQTVFQNPERYHQKQENLYFDIQTSTRNESSPCLKKNKSDLRCRYEIQLLNFEKQNKTSKKDFKKKKIQKSNNQGILGSPTHRKSQNKALQLIRQIRAYYLKKLEKSPYESINRQCLLSDSLKKKDAKIIIKYLMKALQDTLACFKTKQQSEQRIQSTKQRQISSFETDVSDRLHKFSSNRKNGGKSNFSSELSDYQRGGKTCLSRNKSASKVMSKTNFTGTPIVTDRKNKVKSFSRLKVIKETDNQRKVKLKESLISLNVVLDIITYKQMPEEFQKFKSGQKYIEQLNGTSKGTLMKLLNHKLLFVHKKYCLE